MSALLPQPPTEATPLFDATARSPARPSTPVRARARARALSLVFPPLLLIPLVLYMLTLFASPPPLAHPGIAESGPIHVRRPHVPLSFLALGDWGRNGRHGQRLVAQAMADTVSHTLNESGYNPHFIISTGDNFYKNGVASLQDDQFSSSYTDVYNHTVLSNVPWYVVLGNHDHVGSIRAQVDYTNRDPRWNMPATYFAHRFTDSLVAIFLDTTPFLTNKYGNIARDHNRQSPQAQLRWLKRQLADTPADSYFLIIAHHPMYTMSTNGHLGSSELRQMVEPLLLPYHSRILAYISGHEHSLMHMQPYGRQKAEGDNPVVFSPVVDHFISGAGSKLDKIKVPAEEDREKWQRCCGILPLLDDADQPRTVWGEAVHGFFSFRFNGRDFTAEAVDDNGKIVYTYRKTVA